MNNFTFGDICRLFCCPPRPSRVVAKFAFLPPPPSYNVIISKSNSHLNPNKESINNVTSTNTITTPATDNKGDNVILESNDINIKIKQQQQHHGSLSSIDKVHFTERNNKTTTGNNNNHQEQRRQTQSYETWKLTLTQQIDWTLSAHARERIEMFFTQSRARSRIACMFVPTDVQPASPYALLFSHGNAVDLGQMAGFLTSLAQTFGINVFCYDYSGYGLSTGQPLESNLYADADAVLQSVQQRYGYSLDKIILYGQSIGTAPTVDLAARHKVAGVVLHSALMSGIRVICPGTTRRYCFDPFTNIDKVERIQSPTLVIHGEADEIIGVEHGYRLYENLRNPVDPIWIEDAGHNDVESFPEYSERLSRFLRQDLPNYWNNQRRDSLIKNGNGNTSITAAADVGGGGGGSSASAKRQAAASSSNGDKTSPVVSGKFSQITKSENNFGDSIIIDSKSGDNTPISSVNSLIKHKDSI